MIARIEALNYRCLRDVSHEVGRLNILIGPNASGKSSFLDALVLLRDFLNDGMQDAILIGSDPSATTGRCRRIEELFFHGAGDRFEVAIELTIPTGLRDAEGDRARYEVAFGRAESGELVLFNENFGILGGSQARNVEEKRHSLLSVWTKAAHPGTFFTSVHRDRTGVVKYKAEQESWFTSLKVGPGQSALVSVPEEPDKFPVTLWVREVLRSRVNHLALNPKTMRLASSPSLPNTLLTDGSNLPRVLQSLKKEHLGRFDDWVTHVRSVLPDLRTIDVVERPEDRHLYLRLQHTSGEPLPCWLLSDGTLRMLALLMLPYLPVRDSVYLVEEPENGVHPQVIESVYKAFSAIESNQILVATHSPLFLSCANLRELLCFTRDQDGATVVRRGDQHPRLKDWRGEVDLATLYAAGVFS